MSLNFGDYVSKWYDPYGDVNEISYSKREHTNGDAGMKTWAENNAKPHYSNLVNNGYGEVADFLHNSNADTSYGWQKGYQYGINYNPYTQQRADMDDFISNQRTNANAALESGYANTKAQTDKGIEDINNRYVQSGKSLYNNYLQNSRNLGQQLSAMGYTGGATESSMQKMMSDYNASAGNLASQKESDISALNAQLLQAYYDMEAKKAANENEFSKMWLDQYNTDADRTMQNIYNDAMIKNLGEQEAQGWAKIEQDARALENDNAYKMGLLNQGQQEIDWNKFVDDRDFSYGQNQDNIANYLTLMGLDPDRADLNKAAQLLGQNGNSFAANAAGTFTNGGGNGGGGGSGGSGGYGTPVVVNPLSEPTGTDYVYSSPLSPLVWEPPYEAKMNYIDSLNINKQPINPFNLFAPYK